MLRRSFLKGLAVGAAILVSGLKAPKLIPEGVERVERSRNGWYGYRDTPNGRVYVSYSPYITDKNSWFLFQRDYLEKNGYVEIGRS